MFRNLFSTKKESHEKHLSSGSNLSETQTDVKEAVVERKKEVHGEDGVCCGGCGGE